MEEDDDVEIPPADAKLLFPLSLLIPMAVTEKPKGSKDERKPWEIRAASIDAVTKVLEEQALVSGLAMGDAVKSVAAALRKALRDTNANLRPRAAAALALLARAVGPAFVPFAKAVSQRLFDMVADKKSSQRDPALACLTCLVTHRKDRGHPEEENPATEASLDATLGPAAEALSQASARGPVAEWLASRFRSLPPGATMPHKGRVQALAGPLLACGLDRTAPVRKAGFDCAAQAARFGAAKQLRLALSELK